MNIAAEAAKDCLVLVNKQIAKFEKQLNAEKGEEDAPAVYYKGEAYYSYEELQEAYGCDAFTMATFERLQRELEQAQEKKQATNPLLEKKIKYFKYFARELQDTMEMEMEKDATI